MSCVKTGFHAFLETHGIFLYGDAFEVSGVLIFRVCYMGREPARRRKHYTIKNYLFWFDDEKTSDDYNSTLVVAREDVVSHGYDGIDVCR